MTDIYRYNSEHTAESNENHKEKNIGFTNSHYLQQNVHPALTARIVGILRLSN
jgi:hypothetical protein